MTVYLVWQKGRSTSSGQPMLLGIYSTLEAAKNIANEGDRKVSTAIVDGPMGEI